MGQRFRLKANFDISSFPADVQVILRALKKYGMILADNGSAWFISGAPDDRWDNDHLATMRNIPGSAYEAVDESSLMIDPNSGQARQSGVSVAVTPASAVVKTGATQQFTASVLNAADASVTWAVNGVVGGSAANRHHRLQRPVPRAARCQGVRDRFGASDIRTGAGRRRIGERDNRSTPTAGSPLAAPLGLQLRLDV